MYIQKNFNIILTINYYKMKKTSMFKYSLIAAIGIALISCETDSVQEPVAEIENVTFKNAVPIDGQYIVVFNDDFSGRMPALAKVKSKVEYRAQMNTLKGNILNEFKSIDLKEEAITSTYGHALKGFAAKLSEVQLETLRNDPRVKRIEQDQTLSISPFAPPCGSPNGAPCDDGGGGGGGSDPAQQVPYGTTRVGGGNDPGATAWVIDTGIDLDHPDLNVDTVNSASFLTGGGGATSPDDQNGHGTHVAGTIGALDNLIGSLGVAPGTLVVAVRVLDRRGSGSNSGVIEGVNYVAATAEAGDVANMSLGGGISTALDNAVIAAAATGIKFALAAGNSSTDANNSSPARANGGNIYTISAMSEGDNWASFSNYGNPPVDYCAPGVAVFSTWKDGGYNTISGTSMAAPHAAGVLSLGVFLTDGIVNNDPDNEPDEIIVHTKPQI
jgi:subtilisin family serine protease